VVVNRLVKPFDNWRRGWDSFSPLVLGAHHLAPVAAHALFIHRAATVHRSRPPSLSFAPLTLLPLEAFGLASNPTFFSLCLFSHDIRNTIYEFMADAAATNSNFWENNRLYQNISCPPPLSISKTIPESNPTALIGNAMPRNSKRP